MAETSLTLDYWDVLYTVSDYLGMGPDSATRLSTPGLSPVGDELRIVRSVVESGYRMFLFPMWPGDVNPYKWKFLSPTTTLAIVADDGDYDLPDDYGGMVGTFHYAPTISVRRIEVRSVQEILDLRAAHDTNGEPYMCAIRPKAFTRTTGQRYEVLFYPEPDASRTLYYQYNVLVAKYGAPITSGTSATLSGTSFTKAGETFTTKGVVASDWCILDNASGPTKGRYSISAVPTQTTLTLSVTSGTAGTADYEILPQHIYHLGGAVHSETVQACCLAVAEMRRNDERGIWWQEAQRLLAGSIAHDRANAPDTLGYCGDNSDEVARFSYWGDLTYESGAIT